MLNGKTFLCNLRTCGHKNISASNRHKNKNGRFYTRGRIIRLDELGQTFLIRVRAQFYFVRVHYLLI